MKQHEPTSLSLLERLRGHDDAAWQRLVVLYGPLIRVWCQRGGVQGEDSADVAQEVFAAMAAGLGSFQRQREGSFRAWVRGITRYKLLDHYRSRGSQPAATGGSEALQRVHELPDPTAVDDADEVGDLYRRALDLIRGEFEERTWEAFWRAGIEGQDTAAVAAALGMTPVAVRIAKSRVLGRLRAEAGDLID